MSTASCDIHLEESASVTLDRPVARKATVAGRGQSRPSAMNMTMHQKRQSSIRKLFKALQYYHGRSRVRLRCAARKECQELGQRCYIWRYFSVQPIAINDHLVPNASILGPLKIAPQTVAHHQRGLF